MRARKDKASIVALTVANLAPLAGVLLLGWDAGAIVLLAWSENLVVGFYALLKIAFAKVEKPAHHLGKLLFIAFFCMHFGGFCAGHGFFILNLFRLGEGAPSSLGGRLIFTPDLHWPFPLVFLELVAEVMIGAWHRRPPGMEWQVLCLFLSHGVSFVQNYLLGREYASPTMLRLMGQPYGRMVLMHLAVIAGAAAVMWLGSPVPLLFLLIGLKIVVDITLHKWSHGEKGAEEQLAHLIEARLIPAVFAVCLSALAVGSVYFAWDQHRKATISFLPYFLILVSAPWAVGCTASCFRDRVPWLSGQWDRRKALMAAAVWHGIGIAAWGHYFAVAARPYETFAIVTAAVYEGLGLIPLAAALPEQGVLGRLREAFFAALFGGFLGLWLGTLVGGFGGLAVGLISQGIFGRAVGGAGWAIYGMIAGPAVVGALFGLASLLGSFQPAPARREIHERRGAARQSGRTEGQ